MHDTYLLRNNDMKFEMVQSMVTHTNFMFRSKFHCSQDSNAMAEMAVKYVSTRRLTL